MSDNNAGYNDSDQDNYYASNNSAQADFGQFQDGRNQPAAQPYNPNPYASQQPAQPFYGQPTYGQPDYTQSSQPPYYQQQAQPRYEQPSYNQPPIYAQQTYYQAAQQQPGYGYAQKSKIVAGLLGLFLGGQLLVALGGLDLHGIHRQGRGSAVADPDWMDHPYRTDHFRNLGSDRIRPHPVLQLRV